MRRVGKDGVRVDEDVAAAAHRVRHHVGVEVAVDVVVLAVRAEQRERVRRQVERLAHLRRDDVHDAALADVDVAVVAVAERHLQHGRVLRRQRVVVRRAAA